jgi:tetratricopeptide (TPR) repeat protein
VASIRLCALLGAALALLLAPSARAQKPAYQEPPEEDKSLPKEAEYSFNPLQAEKEFRVGLFYWKKGSFKAAAGRFEEAVKWNPSFAEAYFRLAEAREKLAEAEIRESEKQALVEAAAEAYKKFLELEPDGDKAKTARKKLARLERPTAQAAR